MSKLINGLAAMDHALPDYLTAEKYYEGTVPETFATEAVRRALGKSIGEFSFNYARLVVSSRLSRMEVSSVTTVDDSANEFLGQVWTDNSMDQEVQDAIEGCLVYGDAYLIAFPNDSDGVDVFYNDPKSTRVFYDVENPRKKAYAIKRWLDGDRLRVNIYTETAIEKYISKGKPSSSMVDQDFEPYFEDEQEAWPLVNETGTIPVFHLRTSRQYGRPEHQSAYPAQNAISKILSVQVSSIDFSSFPQRYFLQDPTANDGVNPASDFGMVDEDDDDSVANLKAGPGGVWNLKGIKQVGQFDVSDPSVFIEPFKAYVDSISATTQTPMHLFQVGALPSGESLRAAEAPLNKRVESLELLIGGVLREMHEYILGLAGYTGVTVTIQWAPAGTYDDSDVWAVVEAKTSAGVPLRQALMETGYTAEQLEEWYPEGESARSPKEVALLADAIQKLGAAATLGVISIDEARKLLPKDIAIEIFVNPAAALDALEPEAAAPEVNAADDIKSKAEAMGILIRAGVESNDAAERVGLAGVEFTGAMPTSLRLPEAEASKLEEA